MAFSERSLDDYVDVAQRIADFREQYPHGSLQPADLRKPWEQAIVSGYRKDGTETTQTFIVYTAAAYRTPDDARPGIGIAWEIWPGRTPYTLGSELMNAETSAWGRAIIAVLASDSKAGVASRQEVKARRAEREDGLPVNADGSLSRSRTTDAEKDAAGVMTAAQQAEHTALQPKQAEIRGKVTRIKPEAPGSGPASGAPARTSPGPAPVTAVPGDPWLDQPAGHLPVDEHWPPDEDLENKPGTVSAQQQRAIHAACTGMDRAKRLATIGDIVGRQVASSNELSYTEAARVLGKLSGARA